MTQNPNPGTNYLRAFNQDTIIYDNTPWRPGRDIEPVEKSGVEDERKLKNVATRIMSNGVEVLVKDKSGEGKLEQRKLKVMHLPSMKPSHAPSSSSPKKSLLSSAVATVVNHQQISALFPLHQLMQHNYIIKTCMTTYTYLTTVVQNKRSAISTFETIVSVVTTESISNYPDIMAEIKPTKTKYMEVKTIKPSAPINMYASDFVKIDKRIDNTDDGNSFELIQPSEANHVPCSGYSCSDTKTESLKTKYTSVDASAINMNFAVKSSKLKLDVKPTNKDDMKTQYPYKFESSSHEAPTDKLVQKYTEVMNDYSEEKESNSVEESELLTNEQAPGATHKVAMNKIDKVQQKKPEKVQKINKSKFQVADLLKLGSLGIKGLTQLAPVIEKMTGCFTKKQAEIAAGKAATSTTIKPAEDLVAYSSNKRIDNILEAKQGTFPIYIPVDELETSESQSIYTNATLHQNLAWAAEHKYSKSHVHPLKMIHESPLVNGGIPISPGEIITANSDVIVGKPAVGGPLTLAASGIKLHNPVNPPSLDSFVAANEQFTVNERPLGDQPYSDVKVDDSFDLRPPSLPNPKPNRPHNSQRPVMNNDNFSKYPYRMPNAPKDDEPKKPAKSSSHGPVNVYHGSPLFMDYIPSLASFATNNGKPNSDSFNENNKPTKHHRESFDINNAPSKHLIDYKPAQEAKKEIEIPDNSPSSSEIVNTHIKTDEEYTITGDPGSNQPFLVDIQPSRVANVLIPHGSSTALVFAGSSEPHKTGDYVDDPLPYPEPGYFGSFSIDAPKMTNVHNVAPNNKPFSNKHHIQSPLEPYKPNPTQYKEQVFRNDQKFKWKDSKRPTDFSKIPPPTSNQETHSQVGPQITVYNPDVYNPSNGDFDKYNQVKTNNRNKGKEVIDKEYENYLAVPPPPPKTHYNDNKNKPYNQRPIVQTKPVQDMSVLLNIQHPVPKEQQPPKVTSEIYFAAQAPNDKQTPTYTIRMPPSSPTYSFNKYYNNVQPPKTVNTGSSQNSYVNPTSHNFNNKSTTIRDNDQNGNTYTVTLNTATNVASNVNNDKQVIGSSVPVEIGNGQINADIPIGTNFAIRVEENNTPLESYNLQGNRNSQIVFDHNNKLPDIQIGDNRWNKSTIETNENTIIGHNYRQRPVHINEVKPPTTSTIYESTVIGQSYAERPTQNNALPSNKNTVIKLNYGERPSQEYATNPEPPTNENKLTGLNYGEIQGQGYIRPSKKPQHENTHTRPNSGKISLEDYTPRPYSSVSLGERPAQEKVRPTHPTIREDVNKELNFGDRPLLEYAPRPSPVKHYVNSIIGQSYSERPEINSGRPQLNSYTIKPISPPSTNSHANFPMMNDDNIGSHSNDDVKPVTEKVFDSKRPGKLIPNLPTNSHGWYSSVVIDENNVKNIDIKTESTTRKVIPLQHDGKDSLPPFGQKITSPGKPPSEFWTQNKPHIASFNVGRPFTKPATEKPSSVKPFTLKPYKHNYIPNLGEVNQPAYDIPIRDNSAETTTHRIVEPSTKKVKPVYENAEEVFDGEEELDNSGETDGEVSSESMKVPVVSASNEVATNERPLKPSTELTLLQDEVLSQTSTFKPQTQTKKPDNFNSGSQTEKPFGSFNKSTTFQTNAIKPIYDSSPYMKPRPFTMGTAPVLDHQLQQPHWQINQLMENSTNNMSYEDNLELNIGEEMNAASTIKTPSTQKLYNGYTTESNLKYKNPPRPVYSARPDISYSNDSNIITSTVHINDKKPLIVEKQTEKTTLPSFTISSDVEINRTSSEIIDLSPPPPTMDYSFKPSTNDEMIMGMSPPPPRNRTPVRQPPRNSLTPKPIPVRTPPQHLNKPPRTLPPRLPQQRPTRKPNNRDEISTYRPAYDILNNIRRPAYNRDQPSSQLLPPPREIFSRPINPVPDTPASVNIPAASHIVFPTPISSGWLTSSGVEFSSSFNFGPSSVRYPETPKPSRAPEPSEPSPDSSYSYENEYSSENVDESSSEKPLPDDTVSSSKESSTESSSKTSSSKEKINDSFAEESSQEQATTDRMKVVPIGNKNRTRKPYPFRNEVKKPSINKFKLPPRPTPIIRPTRTLNRPEILYPTRQTSIKNIFRPISTKSPVVVPSIIESSESFVDEEFIKPTEVLKVNLLPTISQHEDISLVQKESTSTVTPNLEDVNAIPPTHHTGNEIKISDEIIPTKTEFKTTVITHTKILSEPPLTISNVDYVNLTHTLTVTHTETSLVTQLEGAVTQTFVLTNTYISTIMDVVTEIQVQPTTIIETVTKHIPVQVQPTPVQNAPSNTKIALDDITMSSEEEDNLIIKDSDTTESIQKGDTEGDGDNDTFFVVMNKSQNGGQVPPINNEIETGDYDVTRNEQVNNNGVSQVLFGEILLAGTPYLETTNVHSSGFGKECQPDCKASRNERCQRIDGIMKCVCRPGFARMFPDRPCKPTYTYSVKLALGSQGNDRLLFQSSLADNSSKHYQALAFATHEGINRMVMQSDLRDVYHGVHITGFQAVQMKDENGDDYQGVMNDFYVQLSDNAHESRLKEVIEKYLRNNNYSLGGTDVHAAGELVDRLDVSDFNECTSGQFHDCSEHAQCFNLRGTYTCSCLEGFADLSVNNLYPGRVCSAEPVGCERCNYHGSCYSRDDQRVLCECFQWYAGSTCQVNLKVVLISLVVLGALLTVVLAVCAVVACSKKQPRPPKRSIVTCIQSMPSLHQGAGPSKQRQDRRALINERGDSGDASSVQNASLPYMPAKRVSTSKQCITSAPPSHSPPPPPPAVLIPRARLHAHDQLARRSADQEDKLISYLEAGVTAGNDEMRRKHSLESSYSANKERHCKQGALVSAGYKVSTTIRPDEVTTMMTEERDDLSSVNKVDLEDMGRFDSLRKSYSQEDLSEWTDAERRMGELTLSEARSVGGTLPASTGRAASSTRLTHQEANTMAERDLGSTFLLPHVHLYRPDLTSDVSEFDSL